MPVFRQVEFGIEQASLQQILRVSGEAREQDAQRPSLNTSEKSEIYLDAPFKKLYPEAILKGMKGHGRES